MTEELYKQLLRKAIGLSQDSIAENAAGDAELHGILRLCQIHGTGPLVYNELLKMPSIPQSKVGGLTEKQRLQMKQACMQNMMLQGQWELLISKCFGALADKGVHAVLMKGFSYAHMYPLPYLRSWGDLDVWVGTEQYHKACGILREAFPEAKHHDEEWDELKHYCFVFPNGMAIELHRVSMDFLSPKDQAYWCRLEQPLSRLQAGTLSPIKGQGEDYYIEVSGIKVAVFEPKLDLLFCFLHSWEHFTGTGIPLKQVCDTVLLMQNAKRKVQSEELEAYLEKHLRALHMLDVWRTYGYMACKVMGLPFEQWPLLVQGAKCKVQSGVVKYGERLYAQVMAEGQCRQKDYGEAEDRYQARENARKMNVLARKWLTLTQRIEKALFMYRFAPKYACYTLWQEVQKGIRRTVRGAEMIDY